MSLLLASPDPLQEVEDALVPLADEQTRRDHLTPAANAAQQTADL